MNLQGIPGIVIVMQFTFAVTHWLLSSACYLTIHCNSVCDVVNFTVLLEIESKLYLWLLMVILCLFPLLSFSCIVCLCNPLNAIVCCLYLNGVILS